MSTEGLIDNFVVKIRNVSFSVFQTINKDLILTIFPTAGGVNPYLRIGAANNSKSSFVSTNT